MAISLDAIAFCRKCIASAVLVIIFAAFSDLPRVLAEDAAPAQQSPPSKSVTIRGKVVSADLGPAVGVRIEAQPFDSVGKVAIPIATTDENGWYTIALDAGRYYTLGVVDQKWAAAPQAIKLGNDPPENTTDFTLIAGAVLRGTVADAKQRPLGDQKITVEWSDNFDRSPRDKKGPHFEWATTTDAKGRYAIHLGPGEYKITGPTKEYKMSTSVDREKELVVDYHVENGSAFGQLTGVAVDSDGKPVPGALIEGYPLKNEALTGMGGTADASGKWKSRRTFVPSIVGAHSPDGKLTGVARLEPDQSEITLQLVPAAEVHGKLLNEQGQPAAGQQLRYGVPVRTDETDPRSPWQSAFGGTVTTDEQGGFTLRGLIPGQKYNIEFDVGDYIKILTTVASTQGEKTELADLSIPKRNSRD